MGDRNVYLKQAQDNAKLTIPALFPPEGTAKGQSLRKPFQSLGAKAVNSLASKIVLALFPPNTAFFKLGFSQDIKKKLEGDGHDVEALSAQLGEAEQVVVKELEKTNMRSALNKHVKK